MFKPKCLLPKEIKKKYELKSIDGYLCLEGISLIYGTDKEGKFRSIIEDKNRDIILLS